MVTFWSEKGLSHTAWPSFHCRRTGETPENLNAEENIPQTADHTAGTPSFDSQGSNPKGATYCRVIAIAVSAAERKTFHLATSSQLIYMLLSVDGSASAP
jgi:hypothetical protein